LERSLRERPNPDPEETEGWQDRASSTTRAGKKTVHSLMDKGFSRKKLALAWEKVKKKQGSAGIDDVTIEKFERRKASYLDLGHRKRRDGTSRPPPVKRGEIDKSAGGVSTLGIPRVLDRVVQQALVQRLAPSFEPRVLDWSDGYRKGRSPPDAMHNVWQALQTGDGWIVEADLRAYFATQLTQPSWST
jgi:RNA-directed DNA polymerase